MFTAKIKHHPRQRLLEASGDVSTRHLKAPIKFGVDMAMDADDYPTDLIKRLLDLLIASAAIALTLPLMLLVSLLIKCDSPGPILDRQERVGLRGRTFALYKFRSMRHDGEGIPTCAAGRGPGVTRVGRFIRCTRIDELPQLLNVLRGEMSIVGPRPKDRYIIETLSAAIPFYAERHYVRPGITGWAQLYAVHGVSIEDFREELGYDLYYVKNRSFLLDVRILISTVCVIFFEEGIR
jgi:lipopolysaccharide/colanic/teichoic acid biosynthesis glycosyltransferase